MAPFGVLNVYKPAGLTSRDAVDRVERLVRPAKAGHAGTLDPLATGVLVICVGQATRLIRFVQQMRKRYLATFLLGQSSETDDVEREVVAIPNAVVPTRALIDSTLPQFVGEIQQRPPAHSAIKIAGRRAYKLARKGVNLDLAARTVTIHQLDVLRYEYPELDLDIECGSGTYIRALGRDLGNALGTAALIAVEDLPRVTLTDAELIEIRYGRWIVMPRMAESETEWAAVDAADRLVAILHQKHQGQLWPVHNFGV
jgi:tRNA pseudouridine55 synthase